MSRKTNSKWSEEEDERLTQLVLEMGPKQWTLIAERLGTRAGKQCRERWKNQLDPEIDHSPFTAEDDQRILDLVNEMGTKWADISKIMTGRTENGIKNRYYSSLLKTSQKQKKEASRRRKKMAKTKVKPANSETDMEDDFVVPNTPPAQSKSGTKVTKIRALKPRTPISKPSSACKPPRLLYKQEAKKSNPSTCHLPILADFVPSMAADRMLETSPGVWQRVLSQDFDAAVALLSMQWSEALKDHEAMVDDTGDEILTEAAAIQDAAAVMVGDIVPEPVKKAKVLPSIQHELRGVEWTDLLNHRHITD